MLDRLKAQANAIHNTLINLSFPGVCKHLVFGEGENGGYYTILAKSGSNYWFELWLDEWLSEPAYCVCIEERKHGFFSSLIRNRPDELFPRAHLSDIDIDSNDRLKSDSIKRIRQQINFGELIYEEYKIKKTFFLSFYILESQFSVGAAVKKFKFLAGLADSPNSSFHEGSASDVTQTKNERNPAARAACIAHYGTACNICSFDFEKIYGTELGAGFIHVHHLEPLSNGPRNNVDPITDLIPVCPNCHAMLHRRNPPMSPSDLKRKMK